MRKKQSPQHLCVRKENARKKDDKVLKDDAVLTKDVVLKYDIDFEKKRINWKSKAERSLFWEELFKCHEAGEPLCKCTIVKCLGVTQPTKGFALP